MSIHQGHDQFSDKCRERQEFMDLFSLTFDQLWPAHQWRCEEIDCFLRHGDDLLLHNSTVSSICPFKHLIPCNKRIHRPIFAKRVLCANNGFPLTSSHFHIEISSLFNKRSSSLLVKWFDVKTKLFFLPVNNLKNALEIHKQMGAKLRGRVIASFNYFSCMEKELETGNETYIQNVNCEPVTGTRYGNRSRSGNLDCKRNVNLEVR